MALLRASTRLAQLDCQRVLGFDRTACEVGFSVTSRQLLHQRESTCLVDCSKKLTLGRSVKVSFRERKEALCPAPKANDFGTIRRSLAQAGAFTP
jgi:hypothetical protein